MKTNKINLTFLFVLFDFVICFGISLLGSATSFSPFSGDFLISSVTVCCVLATIVVLFFWVGKFYTLAPWAYGLGEWAKMFISSLFLIGILFGLTFLLPESYWPHFSAGIVVFCCICIPLTLSSYRFFPKIIAIFKSKNHPGISPRKTTIIVGAGAAGQIAFDDSKSNPNSSVNVIGFVDDDPQKIGRFISKTRVLGPISSLKEQIERYHADEVIIAIQRLSKEQLKSILALIKDCDVQVCRFPILSELNGVNRRSIFAVDINDLLGRDPVVLDNSAIDSMICGKSVLITGAGGSIGSEIVRQIFKAKPKTLILFDIYENGVYSIQQEIIRAMKKEGNSSTRLVTLIGSTYNETRVEQVIRDYRPDFIYHAAAYKHVPLMEESPAEAVRSNVIGTYNVARMADKYGVKKMLLISTDKAVRPTNAMGATKRFAEMIIQYFASISKNTKYCAVRFGNVLGSNGSVIPLFVKQIEDGGPVTITDPNIIRFFMTIPEAVGLVLQSSLFAEGGEIFILDMGKPVKIKTLAEKMIRQAGYVPDRDIKIVYTGLRPGEKLYEETLIDPKKQTKTDNNRIYIEKKSGIEPIEKDISFISSVFGLDVSSNTVKEAIKKVVATYTPEMDD